VEFNASKRAMQSIRENNIAYDDELNYARKTLTAAALTYVAALATGLLSLLRLIAIAGGRRRD
jgi:Zn-dependent membrane protease YugP